MITPRGRRHAVPPASASTQPTPHRGRGGYRPGVDIEIALKSIEIE